MLRTPKTPIDSDTKEVKLPENQLPTNPTDVPERQFGIILWLLLTILATLLVGLYLWWQALESYPTPLPAAETQRPTAAENREPESTNAVVEVDAFATMSTSDELAAIEADLESTRLELLTAEQAAIETELERDQQ